MTLVKIAIFSTLLRLFVRSTQTAKDIQDWIEVSSPLHSNRRVREALFLEDRGCSPYAGWSYHGVPLLLPILRHTAGNDVLCVVPYTIADLAAGWTLERIGHRIADAAPLSAIYLLNPFTVLSCVGCSIGGLYSSVLLLSIHGARSGCVLSATALACATYIDPHSALYLVLSFLHELHHRDAVFKGRVFLYTGAYLASMAVLCFASQLYLNCFDEHRHHSLLPSIHDLMAYLNDDNNIVATDHAYHWMLEVYGFHLKVGDLTPNMGLWWYFFTEMFPFYRQFFRFVFHSACCIFTVPFSIAFSESPLFALLLQAISISIFKPYPTVADYAFVLELLLFFPELLKRIEWWWFMIASGSLLVVLEPVMQHEWIQSESANANFYYSTNLLIALWQIVLVCLLIEAKQREGMKIKNE